MQTINEQIMIHWINIMDSFPQKFILSYIGGVKNQLHYLGIY